ncbi:hypothetical protein [Hwanghaeella sp.]|uniref:hypothetical protein n=1 Tax=Hwanghaeella sp. TaxID=2605943 RepID=UPI003CCC0CDB
MKRVDPYQFYELGIALRALGSLEGGQSVGQMYSKLFNAQNRLKRLLDDEPLIEVRHCRHEAQTLLDAIASLVSVYVTGEDGKLDVSKWNEAVPEYALYGVHGALGTFEHNFAAEMREAAVYAASQVGMYNTGDLVSRTEIHIPDNLRKFVNDKAIFEIQSAGRCLAFGLPTACGYHILRATECVLEDYYGIVSGEPGSSLSSWNEYAKALDKLSEGDDKEAPSKRVIRCIRQIKDLDRNPIMHPRDVLEEVDAQILFMVATSAISEMAKCLRNHEGQTELRLVAPEQESN